MCNIFFIFTLGVNDLVAVVVFDRDSISLLLDQFEELRFDYAEFLQNLHYIDFFLIFILCSFENPLISVFLHLAAAGGPRTCSEKVEEKEAKRGDLQNRLALDLLLLMVDRFFLKYLCLGGVYNFAHIGAD